MQTYVLLSCSDQDSRNTGKLWPDFTQMKWHGRMTIDCFDVLQSKMKVSLLLLNFYSLQIGYHANSFTHMYVRKISPPQKKSILTQNVNEVFASLGFSDYVKI